MKITIEFNSVDEYLELKEKVLSSKIKKLIDDNKEQYELIDIMTEFLGHLERKFKHLNKY